MVTKTTGKKPQQTLTASFWCPNRLVSQPGMAAKHNSHKVLPRAYFSSCWFTVLTIFACASMLRFLFLWQPGVPVDDGCTGEFRRPERVVPSLASSVSVRAVEDANPGVATHNELPPGDANMTWLEREFWKQPEGAGVVACIEPSEAFAREGAQGVAQERGKYLMVVVNGGLNQQRNQIVDAVVMARVLRAALVVPVMEVNPIWEDESEFSDIFDIEHFKETLKNDVRIVSSLPSTHVMIRPLEEKHTPLHASPQWLRQHYQGKISREGVLLLRGLDSRLAKDLTPDLQKLRCKVAFHALRFAKPIRDVGTTLAERMARHGPYAALHLRLEVDVWVRTGCLPGLGPLFDQQVRAYRKQHPWMLTSRGAKLGFTERKLAGLCPLTATEVARLLKALGASRRTRIYWAGGEPLGKDLALQPLRKEFPNLFNKGSLATPPELEPFRKKASSLAAIDYLVCLHSDVFLQSHGGNFGRVMQGHRAYMGHRKHIVPNKRQMIPHFLNTTMSQIEFDVTIRALHADVVGKPVQRALNSTKDVLAHPFPECMCVKPQRSL